MKDIQNKPLVSVITINYDQPEVTCALLESLRKITYTPIEIIVVDNASPTKEPDPIKEQYPEIHLIRSDKNLGFAGGNNIGIKAATGEYFLLINNDTEVEPDFLEPLVSKLESDFNIGAVSPKIRYFNQKELIQFAGYTEMNPVTIRNQGIGFQEIDRGQYDQDAPTYFLFGAAMLIPRRIFQKVGLMADIFFLYYEEIDWFHRIRNAGYQLYYIHNSLVYHKDSVTTGSGSPMKIYYLNRNRLLYMRRNTHGLIFVIGIFYQFFVAIPKNSIMFLLTGGFSFFRAYMKAIGWHLSHLNNHQIFLSPSLD